MENKAGTTRNSRDKELENLLNQFTNFIKTHIQRYHPQKFGLDPEDIAQDVRIKLWRLVDSEKTITNYASYIRKIVNTSVIDQFRKLRRDEGIFHSEKMKHVSEKEKFYIEETEPDRHLKALVSQAVDSLIESRRQVVKLYLLELSIEEISSYLRWSQDKTRNLLYRGLANLKEKLKEMGVDYENR